MRCSEGLSWGDKGVGFTPTSGEDVVKKNEKREPGEIIVRASVNGFELREVRLKRTHEGSPASVFEPSTTPPPEPPTSTTKASRRSIEDISF